MAFELSDKEKAINMLSGASLPGVGPATAERIADHFQGRLEEIMNSEDASTRLAEVHKIGPKTAAKIKEAWDGTRGNNWLSWSILVHCQRDLFCRLKFL